MPVKWLVDKLVCERASKQRAHDCFTFCKQTLNHQIWISGFMGKTFELKKMKFLDDDMSDHISRYFCSVNWDHWLSVPLIYLYPFLIWSSIVVSPVDLARSPPSFKTVNQIQCPKNSSELKLQSIFTRWHRNVEFHCLRLA